MVATNDPRRVVGAIVHSRANRVRADAECKRLYGSEWNKVCVTGVVTGERMDTSSGGRRNLVLTVCYTFPGNNKVTRDVPSRNVKIGEAPAHLESVCQGLIPRDNVLVAGEESQNLLELPDEGHEDDDHSIIGRSITMMEETPTTTSLTSAGVEDQPTTHLQQTADEEEEDEMFELPCGNDRRWTIDDSLAQSHINGAIPHRPFHVSDSRGQEFYAGCDTAANIDLMDYFLCMYPFDLIIQCMNETNKVLRSKGKSTSTPAQFNNSLTPVLSQATLCSTSMRC